ncbi:hypothetical protein ES708_10980 [subsurface metagenome]
MKICINKWYGFQLNFGMVFNRYIHISDIEKSFKPYFSNSTFTTKKEAFNRFIISGDYMSFAINQRREDKSEVKVLKWFDDFWVYFEIIFMNAPKKIHNINLSFSVFQGIEEDRIKTQLFRAEWDSYLGNKIHPQPHWHIYPVKYDYKTYEDFEAYMDLVEEDGGFEKYIEGEGKGGIISISNLHFAMNGQWSSKSGHIHSIDDTSSLLDWIRGLMGHIKSQLEEV